MAPLHSFDSAINTNGSDNRTKVRIDEHFSSLAFSMPSVVSVREFWALSSSCVQCNRRVYAADESSPPTPSTRHNAQ